MDAPLDAILQQVAAGELSPDDALIAIDRLERPAAPAPGKRPSIPPTLGFGSTPPTPWDAPLATLAVRTSYRAVQIVGDPTVREIHVTGVHVLHRDGDRLVLDNPELSDDDRPANGSGHNGPPGNYSFISVPWGRRARAFRDERLLVRVNPNLHLDIDVTGCQLQVSGFHGGATARVLASKLQIEGVSGALDLDAFSSSIKGSILPTGSSRLHAESSSVKVQLVDGADLRIDVRNRMGKVLLPGSMSKGGIADPDHTSTVVGTGRDTLSIDAMMSSVAILAA